MKRTRPLLDLARLTVAGTSLLKRRDVARPLQIHRKRVYRQRSHSGVVCVARGDAEGGLASSAWAERVGLTFAPLGEETHGLLVPTSQLGDPRVVRFLEIVRSDSFRRALEMVAG